MFSNSYDIVNVRTNMRNALCFKIQKKNGWSFVRQETIKNIKLYMIHDDDLFYAPVIKAILKNYFYSTYMQQYTPQELSNT